MKKKIIILVFAITLFQSIRAESFDDPLIFEEYHQVMTDMDVRTPKKQELSVWAALTLAPRYILEQHLKPGFYAMVAVIFETKNELKVERQ